MKKKLRYHLKLSSSLIYSYCDNCRHLDFNMLSILGKYPYIAGELNR